MSCWCILRSYGAISPHPAPWTSAMPPCLTAQVHGWGDQQGADGFLWEAAVASVPREHLPEVQWGGHDSGGPCHGGCRGLRGTVSSVSWGPHLGGGRGWFSEAGVFTSVKLIATAFLFPGFSLPPIFVKKKKKWSIKGQFKDWLLWTPHIVVNTPQLFMLPRRSCTRSWKLSSAPAPWGGRWVFLTKS